MEDIVAKLVGKQKGLALLDYWLRYQDGLDDYVEELDRKHRFTAVIVEYIWLHKAKNKLRPGVLKILDTHDMQHLRIKEFASRGDVFPLRIDREQEAQIFSQFDAVFAIQEQEAKLAREMCQETTVLTVGCGVMDRSDRHEMWIPGRILYVGGYNKPNSDGLRYFLDNSWPRILEFCPEAHLRVCGNVYRSFLNRAFERVEFLGVVEDIETEYHNAEIVINPIWFGTGLKIKTVEALAFGKALVTTAKGIEGMLGNVSESCCIAVEKEDFADAVVSVLQDQRLAPHYARKAAEYAASCLSFEAVYKELFDFLDRFARPQP
jgi:glycosyltransferase involved in cell wall biosynthesis